MIISNKAKLIKHKNKINRLANKVKNKKIRYSLLTTAAFLKMYLLTNSYKNVKIKLMRRLSISLPRY